MTKEELIAENATLTHRVKSLEAQDLDVRTKMSDALGAGTYKENSYSESKQCVYSWLTMFREIGKLLERKRQEDLEDQVGRISNSFLNIERRVFEIEHPEEKGRFHPKS